MSQKIQQFAKTSAQDLVQIFPELLTLHRGSPETTILDLRAPENASPESLIFVWNQEHFRAALKSESKIWLVAPNLVTLVPPAVKTVLVSSHAQLAMAYIAKRFFPLKAHQQIIEGPQIHGTARISPLAKIGENCKVGPGAVIGDHCEIAADCVIGANTVIEPSVKIGTRSHIHPLVFIGHSCEIGSDCEVQPNTTIGSEGYGYAQDKQVNHHRITHYGRVILEDRVHIGAGVQIDRGTFLDSRIGAGTKIDNHCHFGHNIQIGQNTLITAGMITAGSVTLGSYCVFGGRTTIAGHLSITDRVQLGGMSGVTKSITKPGQYGGLPLQDLSSELRTRASLKSLPMLIKQVRRILNHLKLDADADATIETP